MADTSQECRDPHRISLATAAKHKKVEFKKLQSRSRIMFQASILENFQVYNNNVKRNVAMPKQFFREFRLNVQCLRNHLRNRQLIAYD